MGKQEWGVWSGDGKDRGGELRVGAQRMCMQAYSVTCQSL